MNSKNSKNMHKVTEHPPNYDQSLIQNCDYWDTRQQTISTPFGTGFDWIASSGPPRPLVLLVQSCCLCGVCGGASPRHLLSSLAKNGLGLGHAEKTILSKIRGNPDCGFGSLGGLGECSIVNIMKRIARFILDK